MYNVMQLKKKLIMWQRKIEVLQVLHVYHWYYKSIKSFSIKLKKRYTLASFSIETYICIFIQNIIRVI